MKYTKKPTLSFTASRLHAGGGTMGRRKKINMGPVDYFVLALAIGYISTLGLWGVAASIVIVIVCAGFDL